jgi:hypothetical protein
MISILRALAVALVCLLVSAGAQEAGWKTFVSADGRLEASYPAGWRTSVLATGFSARNAATGEEIRALLLPFDGNRTPEQYAGPMFDLMRAGFSDLEVTPAGTRPNSARFRISYSGMGTRLAGLAVVLKDERKAAFCSYTAPERVFEASRSDELLKTFISGMRIQAAPEASPPAGPLTGKWSTSQIYGDLVNSRGAFARSQYHDEMYEFRADGSFGHVTMASGRLISGLLVQRGSYRVAGDRLILHVTSEDWDPTEPGQDPAYKNKRLDVTRELRFRIEGDRTLTTVDSQIGTRTVFHKQER